MKAYLSKLEARTHICKSVIHLLKLLNMETWHEAFICAIAWVPQMLKVGRPTVNKEVELGGTKLALSSAEGKCFPLPHDA